MGGLVIFVVGINGIHCSFPLNFSLNMLNCNKNQINTNKVLWISTLKSQIEILGCILSIIYNLLYLLYKLIGEAERFFFFVFSQTCHIRFTYSHIIPNLMPHFPFYFVGLLWSGPLSFLFCWAFKLYPTFQLLSCFFSFLIELLSCYIYEFSQPKRKKNMTFHFFTKTYRLFTTILLPSFNHNQLNLNRHKWWLQFGVKPYQQTFIEPLLGFGCYKSVWPYLFSSSNLTPSDPLVLSLSLFLI